MSKDLIKKSEIDASKKQASTRPELTEVDEAAHALAGRMLFGATQPQVSGQDCPRVIVCIDATASMGEFIATRKITPEAAAHMAAGLFASKAGAVGLQVKLAYFRGDQLQIPDKWYDNALELARAIAAIEHQPGWTQHTAFLRHAVEEAEKCAV